MYGVLPNSQPVGKYLFASTNSFSYRAAFPMDIELTITIGYYSRSGVLTLKPMMPYDQLLKIIGTQGMKVGEDRHSTPPVISYHWNGGRKSALDIKVAAGKIVDVIVISPKKQKYSLGKNGDLVDLGD